MVRLLLAWMMAVGAACAAAPEIRGVWVARDSLGSRESIAAMTERLREANFNVIFVNVWSRGYPLWRSEVFERETGVAVDPTVGGRDVLAETIEEAKARGLAVVPWFEYGFVAGWSGNVPEGSRGPLLDKHPEWSARTSSGATAFAWAGNTQGYWLSHAHPEAQRFLLDLIAEVVERYDVPAIQFDRARYPATDCGYDEATVKLYEAEHEGASPPSNPNDAAWMKWRAERLNLFAKAIHERVRAANWRGLVTNAPIVYPFSYVNFLQDYTAWAREGSLDFVSPQIYRNTQAAFVAELENQVARLGGAARLVPGIDVTNLPDAGGLIAAIAAIREKGLPGFVVWYYEGLVRKNALGALKETVLAEAAALPWK